MVKPRKLLLGAIFVGGLLVSNAASAITKEEALAPALAWAGVICVTHPEYQSKSGKCDAKIFVYDKTRGEIVSSNEIYTLYDVWKDGIKDGYRYYFGSAKAPDGTVLKFITKIKKHLDLCEKDEPYIERDSYRGYTIYFCENGKVTEKQRLVYVGSKRLWTMYNSVVWIFSGPSFTRDEYSVLPAQVAVVDRQCGIFDSYNYPLPLNEINKITRKKCHTSIYNVVCMQNPNNGKTACWMAGDPQVPKVAAKIIGLTK